MKNINEMHLLELEAEYEENAPTYVRLAQEESRRLDVSTALLKKYKAEIERLTKPI